MSSSTSGARQSSRNESQMASSTKPPSLETLTISSSPVRLNNTKAMSKWLRGAFPVNHLVLQEVRKENKTRATNGRKQLPSFVMFDPANGRSSKTSPVCLIAGTSRKSSGRWPKSGSMRSGLCWEQMTLERSTSANDSGSWPTPDTNNHRDGTKLRKDNNLAEGGRHGVSLHHAVMWPTPSVAHAQRGNHDEPIEKYLDRVKDYEEGRAKGKPGKSLGVAVRLWPTPNAWDGERGPISKEHIAGNVHQVSLVSAVADSQKKDPARLWPTPKSQDAKHGCVTAWEMTTEHRGTRGMLHVAVNTWPTPRASEWKGVGPLGSDSHNYRLDRKYLDATVQEAEQKTGQLNAEWVSWLMGWPIGWCDTEPAESLLWYSWEVEPDIPRTTRGEKDRVAKLKALGNGQVPQCMAEAFTLLRERVA